MRVHGKLELWSYHLYVQRLLKAILCVVLAGKADLALATQNAGRIFCQKYPSARGCENQGSTCLICHTAPPSLNPYGLDLLQNLSGTLDETLPIAIDKVEQGDSDNDGFTALDEIMSQSEPGVTESVPVTESTKTYDIEVAYKRVKAVFCGENASYNELQSLKAAAQPSEILHQQLSVCLESFYWKQEALYRMADRKIQPLAAVGFGGNVVIGDYRFDYRLFSYVMTGDRDVRELLSAQYHIDESGQPIYGIVPREEPFQLGQRIVIAGGQPLEPSRRAGMITTQWFLSSNTMFALLPRNSAAQAYRAYLGLDIAKAEGLAPVADEPRDVDRKRVAQPDCAVCHSTIDPLAYAFSTYRGIEISSALRSGNPIGTYNAARSPWESEGKIFNQSATDLLQWAEIARNSDAFKKNTVRMIFEHALSRGPAPDELREFEALWKGLPEDGYSVNKMIHRFVETKAFGGRR